MKLNARFLKSFFAKYSVTTLFIFNYAPLRISFVVEKWGRIANSFNRSPERSSAWKSSWSHAVKTGRLVVLAWHMGLVFIPGTTRVEITMWGRVFQAIEFIKLKVWRRKLLC